MDLTGPMDQLFEALELGVSTAEVQQFYEQAREMQATISNRATRDDLERLFLQFAAATAAGPIGWAALVAGNLWAMWEDGIDTTGALIYWPQDIVPDRWECLTDASFEDERITDPGDGFACRPLYLPELPSSPPDARRARTLPAWEMADEVRKAIAKGRPGIPSEVRRAAMWARRLLVGGALEGPQGQIKTPGVPSTAREVWSQAQRGVNGLNVDRVLNYLWQMLTRVDEWAPLMGWILIDPSLLQGLDEYLPPPDDAPSSPRVPRVRRTPVLPGRSPLRNPGPTPEPEPEPEPAAKPPPGDKPDQADDFDTDTDEPSDAGWIVGLLAAALPFALFLL